MNILRSDLPHLKPWLVTRLDALPLDLDSDVLADYLAELLSSEGSEAEVRASTLANLAEFLPEGDAGRFVDGIWPGVLGREWDPNFVKGRGTGNGVGDGAQGGHVRRGELGLDGRGQGTRKRGVEEDGDGQMDAGRYGRGNWRGRGERGGRGARRGRGYDSGAQAFVPQQAMGFPGLDASDPMAMLQAMQAAVLQLQQHAGITVSQGRGERKTGRRCRDYDTKGVCTRGASCPYDHGEDYEEYQPKTFSERGKGTRGGRGTRRGRWNRASFSSTQAPDGDGQKAIVVENIPHDQLDEGAIRTFFEDFGPVEQVEIHAERKLAIVTFAQDTSALAAFQSPRVVFDNRFVKVYWYRPQANDWLDNPRARGGRGRGRGRGGADGYANGHGEDTQMDEPEGEVVDLEAFQRQQEAAQQRFEEIQAAKQKREELDAKLKAQVEEQAALMKKLAEKTNGKADGTPNGMNGHDVHGIGVSTGASNDASSSTTESSQTAALKAKLAALEAEAKSIGLSTDTTAAFDYQDFAPRGRGRGYMPRGNRGYGSYPPRGWYRGRGRGMSYVAMNSGAVRKLDNRPRAFSIVSQDGKGYEQVRESLLQYLVLSDQGDGVKVSKHTSDDSAVLAVFAERYKAEIFLFAVEGLKNDLPHVGKVELKWTANAGLPASAFPDGAGPPQNLTGSWGRGGDGKVDEAMEDDDVQPGTDVDSTSHNARGQATDPDYDVADDDDRWAA